MWLYWYKLKAQKTHFIQWSPDLDKKYKTNLIPNIIKHRYSIFYNNKSFSKYVPGRNYKPSHCININLICLLIFWNGRKLRLNFQKYPSGYAIVILVGDASVGKTNIVSRIVKTNENIGQKNIAPTIGV